MSERTHLRKDKFYTFDIETTTIITSVDSEGNPERHGIIWSGQFFDGIDYTQVRSLREVILKLESIAEENKEESPYKIAIFVHNLSYEFQFIKDFFKFEKILCTSARRIIAAETDQLVFRCSYCLTNQSLSMFLKNEKVDEEYQKTSMDYLVERFPWTEITEEEYKYCANDVIGLHKAVSSRIAHLHNVDINNLPLTSTGYVRKDCRKAVTANKNNRFRFWKSKLDEESFLMNHEAFRGGNTHSNRRYVNKILYDLGQKDEASAYPAALRLYDFPDRFTDMKVFKQKEFDFYLKNWKKWAMLIDVSFLGLRLKNDNIPVPYISVAKCSKIIFGTTKKEDKGLMVDNGRVIAAAAASMVITEIDFMLIRQMYDWDELKILRVKVAKKKPIPKELSDKIMEYYTNKTTLKQEEDDPNFDEDKAYNYARSKELLNGIFGMHVTNPCKSDFEFNNDTHEIEETMRPVQELLDEYYSSFSSFLSYQVGVWVTAYARLMLQEGIECTKNPDGTYDLVYCDTDSCKYLHPERHEKAFRELNEKRMKQCEKKGAFVDFKGKRYYLGIYESEPNALKFKTWGAKKYMYSFKKGDKEDFKITISGVPKKLGKEAILKAVEKGRLKDPFDIQKGFVFHAIKQTSCYNDIQELREYEIEGKKVYYGSNIALYPASYTLGLTYEYEILLDKYKNEMEII